MLMILAVLFIVFCYKFFTSWLWWIIALLLLMDIWSFIDTWQVMFLIGFTALAIGVHGIIKKKHLKSPTDQQK
ncbi:hypothetical protein YK48G_02990 [Lentilactobacillus fungorum]|uniref:Uncharacterized protein n=1 Tax=Lentilactobacillus fungorum TaxID=2201250 RepID=A0ABQ3VY98_9LACO|nr:hypothetical protein [Lentilactobacillus fungorum]GHP12874.1 hypothetical protein YK48G_02990 [Lentilactobacillus fungorum]